MNVLICLPNLSEVNGIKSFFVNYYYKLIKKGYKVDFLLMQKNVSDEKLISHLKNTGAEIREVDFHNIINRVFVTKKCINTMIKNKKYDIVHVNVIDLYAYACIDEASKMKVKKIIYHIHNPKILGKLLFVSDILNNICIKKSNELVACTEFAGKTMFKSKKFSVIENGIQVDDYKFCEEERNYYRKKLNIENNIVIGCIGRLDEQKNPLFVLKILKELVKKDKRIKLIWIGSGKLKKEFENCIENEELKKNVIFFEKREDVNKIYSAMDLFLLPSKYEGLGIVFIEAQCNGLQVVTSENVPRDIKLTNKVKFISLAEAEKKWAEQIYEILIESQNNIERENGYIILKETVYNLNNSENKLLELYNK